MCTWTYQPSFNQTEIPNTNLQAIHGPSTPPSTPVGRPPRSNNCAVETKSHTCLDCGKPFARLYNLKAHRQTTHGAYGSRPYGCDQSGCGRRFMRQADLLRHKSSVIIRSSQHIVMADFVLDSLKESLIRLPALQLGFHTKRFAEAVSLTQSLLHQHRNSRVYSGTY